jgi:hypothetical protein
MGGQADVFALSIVIPAKAGIHALPDPRKKIHHGGAEFHGVHGETKFFSVPSP